MKEKEYIYKLMYSAFVQMRAEAYESKNKKNFRICDLFHKVPLKLLNVENEEDYKIVYQELVNYVNSNGMKQWLDSEINEIERMKDSQSKSNKDNLDLET